MYILGGRRNLFLAFDPSVIPLRYVRAKGLCSFSLSFYSRFKMLNYQIEELVAEMWFLSPASHYSENKIVSSYVLCLTYLKYMYPLHSDLPPSC